MLHRTMIGSFALSLGFGCGAPPVATPAALQIPDEQRPRHKHRHCHPSDPEHAGGERHCHDHHHGPEHHTDG